MDFQKIRKRKCCGDMLNQSRAFTLLELLLAISLGVLLCAGMFRIFTTTHELQQRQIILSDAQQQIYFLNHFLREKIQAAGNWACLQKSPGSRSIPARGMDSDTAKNKLGLTILPGTDLLELHECIRLHDHLHYLPILFFVANTFRVDARNQEIDALFFKIDHYPREELVTDLTHFQLQLGIWDENKISIRSYHNASDNIDNEKIGAVIVHYIISGYHGVLYATLRKK